LRKDYLFTQLQIIQLWLLGDITAAETYVTR
jgi:hypothetical protein